MRKCLTPIVNNALVCLCILAAAATANGQDSSADQAASQIDRKVDQLIQQLDSNRFSERARAGRELEQLGNTATRSLERVVLEGSADASNRAFQILVKNFRSQLPELSEGAKGSLERIANTEENPKSSSAKRILNPAIEDENIDRPMRRPVAPLLPALPPAPRAQGQIPQFAPGPGIQQSLKISMRSINGRKEITVDSDGKKFRFVDDGKSIQVERPDDKDGTKKATYKDKDELKQKDPESFKWYEKANGGGILMRNQIQIQIGGGFGPGGLPPGMIPRRGLQVRPQFDRDRLERILREQPELPASPSDQPLNPKPTDEPKSDDAPKPEAPQSAPKKVDNGIDV